MGQWQTYEGWQTQERGRGGVWGGQLHRPVSDGVDGESDLLADINKTCQGLELVLPVEDLLSCYGDRTTCLQDDMAGEVRQKILIF